MEIERKDKSYCVITRTSVTQQQKRTDIQTWASLHVLMCLIWKHVSLPQKNNMRDDDKLRTAQITIHSCYRDVGELWSREAPAEPPQRSVFFQVRAVLEHEMYKYQMCICDLTLKELYF